MRLLRVLVAVVLFMFLATLFLGGCGQQTTTPQTQEEAENQEVAEEAPTETQEETAQNLDFLVWPGTIRVFRSDVDGTTTLEENNPAFVLFPSPELAQRLLGDPGAEPIALSISGSEQSGSFLEIGGVQVFYLYNSINVATSFLVGYRFSDGSTILETVTFDPATNVFSESNSISISAEISGMAHIIRSPEAETAGHVKSFTKNGIPPIGPQFEVHYYLGVDIEHPQGCYHLRGGYLIAESDGEELFDEETSYPTPQGDTFNFTQEISESDIDENPTLEVFAITAHENLSNYSYQNPPSQPFSITVSGLEEELSDLPGQLF